MVIATRSPSLPPSTMTSSTVVEKKSELNPRTTSYEFGGPLGAALITITIPLMTYLLYFGCTQQNGCPPPWVTIKNPELLDTLQEPDFWKSLWDTEAALMYFGWYAFCVVAWIVLPGDWIEGTLMRNGKKMKYKINGTHFCAIHLSKPRLNLVVFSLLYVPPNYGGNCGCNPTLRSRIVHLPLRQVDWFRHCLPRHVRRSIHLLLRLFVLW